jgi:hypothetical protein
MLTPFNVTNARFYQLVLALDQLSPGLSLGPRPYPEVLIGEVEFDTVPAVT